MQAKKAMSKEIGYTSISKLKQILDCFTFNKPVLTVNQIAKRVDMPTSSLYRYLQAMVNAKFLAHDEVTNTYSVGMYIIEMAGVSLMQYDIRYAALPELNIMSNRLNMNSNLSVLDGCDIFHLGFSTRFFNVPWIDAIGRRTPAYMTAMGRAMLAFKPFDRVRQMIETSHEQQPEFYPLPDFAELEQDLAGVRENQYIIVYNTYSGALPDTACLACPIRRRNSEVCAAISVNWFRDSAEQSYDQALLSARSTVVQSAATISYKLGYVGRAYGSPV
ncbi:MAG: IclR family transcriptional regulator [Eubacteriales bacterium]|nr:IclR family transcriptional regulator [Eubacteriales bacterium]